MPATSALLAQTNGGGGSGFVGTLLLFALLGGAFWFLLVRPQRRRAAAVARVQSTLGVGDEVVTQAGLVGTVAELSDTDVVLETTPGTRVRFLRGAVAAVRSEVVPPDDTIGGSVTSEAAPRDEDLPADPSTTDDPDEDGRGEQPRRS